MGDQASLSIFHRDIEIPINFQEESSLVSFWSLELHRPLEVSRDLRPPVQMRWGTNVSSRISTQDSDIPSCCDMKHDPKFNPLQGSPAFFWVRVSRGPFHLRQKTQGPSLILIAEGKLHLRCWGKVDSNLQSNTGNQLSSWDDMGCLGLSLSCCTDINIHIDLGRLLRESLSIPQGSQTTCTVCCGTRDSYGANEGEMGFILCWFRLHQAIFHSWVDIRVHLVLWQCSWGLSGVLSRKSRSLTGLIRNTIFLCTKCREIKPHLPARGMCHGISRVAAGTCGIFSS